MTMTSTIWHDGENTFSGHIKGENFTVKTLDEMKKLMMDALDEYAKNG